MFSALIFRSLQGIHQQNPDSHKINETWSRYFDEEYNIFKENMFVSDLTELSNKNYYFKGVQFIYFTGTILNALKPDSQILLYLVSFSNIYGNSDSIVKCNCKAFVKHHVNCLRIKNAQYIYI